MKGLSPREVEIIDLSIQGLTNEAIAVKLGLSVGTVNTYWLRIRLKVGGNTRTDVVAKVLQTRSDQIISEARADAAGIEAVVKAGIHMLLSEKDEETFFHLAFLRMFELAVTETGLVGWAADKQQRIQVLTNAERATEIFGPEMAVGKTLEGVFGSHGGSNPALKCHLDALQGQESAMPLKVEERSLYLCVSPLMGEDDSIIGCASVFGSVRPPPDRRTHEPVVV